MFYESVWIKMSSMSQRQVYDFSETFPQKNEVQKSHFVISKS